MISRIILLALVLFLDASSYGQELKTVSSESKSIVNFIIHQFDKKLESGVNQAQLDKIWNNVDLKNSMAMIRVQIIDQKLYVDSYDIRNDRYSFIYYLENLLKKYQINDADFIIYDKDFIVPGELEKKVLGVPAFMQSINLDSVYEKDLFLLPDTYMITGDWPNLIDRIEKANFLYDWNNKINKVFWKGTLTGGSDDIDAPDMSIRLKLVILSKLYPNMIDAQLKAYHRVIKDKNGQYKTSIADFLFGPHTHLKENEDTLYETEHLPEEDHLKYKYLLSLDGNTAAWRRIPWIMLSNSVLVKQESNKMQWFYPAIKPYVHYVPVKEDLTDIFQQIEWMKTHDAELLQISQNAQNFVKNNLMPEDIEIQTVLAINEYSKLHKNKKIIATLPSIDETKTKIKEYQDEKAEKTMPRKKKIKRFFYNLKEQIINLWN